MGRVGAGGVRRPRDHELSGVAAVALFIFSLRAVAQATVYVGTYALYSLYTELRLYAVAVRGYAYGLYAYGSTATRYGYAILQDGDAVQRLEELRECRVAEVALRPDESTRCRPSSRATSRYTTAARVACSLLHRGPRRRALPAALETRPRAPTRRPSKPHFHFHSPTLIHTLRALCAASSGAFPAGGVIAAGIRNAGSYRFSPISAGPRGALARKHRTFAS